MWPVVDKVGGWDAVRDIVRDATGEAPSPRTMETWRRRRALPAHVELALVWALLGSGVLPDPDWFELRPCRLNS